MSDGESLPREEITSVFEASIMQKVIDLKTGKLNGEIDIASFDQRAAASDPDTSVEAPDNASKVRRLPNNALVFDVVENDELKALILPIEGYGI